MVEAVPMTGLYVTSQIVVEESMSVLCGFSYHVIAVLMSVLCGFSCHGGGSFHDFPMWLHTSCQSRSHFMVEAVPMTDL